MGTITNAIVSTVKALKSGFDTWRRFLCTTLVVIGLIALIVIVQTQYATYCFYWNEKSEEKRLAIAASNMFVCTDYRDTQYFTEGCINARRDAQLNVGAEALVCLVRSDIYQWVSTLWPYFIRILVVLCAIVLVSGFVGMVLRGLLGFVSGPKKKVKSQFPMEPIVGRFRET